MRRPTASTASTTRDQPQQPTAVPNIAGTGVPPPRQGTRAPRARQADRPNRRSTRPASISTVSTPHLRVRNTALLDPKIVTMAAATNQVKTRPDPLAPSLNGANPALGLHPQRRGTPWQRSPIQPIRARPRRNASLSTSARTAAADASTGPADYHRNREIPSDASVTSSASSSAQRAGVNSWAKRS